MDYYVERKKFRKVRPDPAAEERARREAVARGQARVEELLREAQGRIASRKLWEDRERRALSVRSVLR